MRDYSSDPRPFIPSINLIAEAVNDQFETAPPHEVSVRLARLVARTMRTRLTRELSVELIREVLDPILHCGPRTVINATGILLHTNLGRAPIATSTVEKALEAVRYYTDLEFDLDTGKRGHRDRHFARLAEMLWGCEDATLVNNAAAAVGLSLAALSGDAETVVSRGELVEIGGSFRLPEIMELARSRLVEVGTTNKTRSADYEKAIGPRTGCLLKTHPSNFRIEGFTQSVSLTELTALGRLHEVPVIMDLGSGLSRAVSFPRGVEPLIEDCLAADPDLLIFSGDKLFGSIQAGIVLGKKAQISRLRKHAMMRMLRLDKLSIAILCRHLRRMVTNGSAPLWSLAHTALEDLRARAAAIVECCPQLKLIAQPEPAYMGGGSLPQEQRDSICIGVSSQEPGKLAHRMRSQSRPVVGYVKRNRFHLNLATVFPEQDRVLAEGLINLAEYIDKRA